MLNDNRQSVRTPVWAIFTSGNGTIANAHNGLQVQFDDSAKLLRANEVPSSGDERNKLRDLRDINNLLYDQKVELQSLSFYAINVLSKGTDELAGATNVPASTVNTMITDSLSLMNWGYNQARLRYGALPSWQPNFFNPIVRFNQNLNYFDGLLTTNPNHAIQHKGDLSVGLSLPFHEESQTGERPLLVIEKFRSVEVYANTMQIIDIDSEHFYQVYPIVCEMKLVIVKDR